MDLALEGDVRLLFFEHDNAHEVRAGPPGSLPPHPPAGIEGPTRAGPMGPFGVRKKRSVDHDGKNGAWIAMARIIAIDGSHYLLSSSGLPDADSSQGGWGWVGGGGAGWGGCLSAPVANRPSGLAQDGARPRADSGWSQIWLQPVSSSGAFSCRRWSQTKGRRQPARSVPCPVLLRRSAPVIGDYCLAVLPLRGTQSSCSQSRLGFRGRFGKA